MRISNRELLRQYKALKEKLLSGEVKELSIPQKNGMTIKITVEKEKTQFEILNEMIDKNPVKDVKRPEADLFDYL